MERHPLCPKGREADEKGNREKQTNWSNSYSERHFVFSIICFYLAVSNLPRSFQTNLTFSFLNRHVF